MRDEELILRFFAFHIHGIDTYRTPLKHWLNSVAKAGRKYNDETIDDLYNVWIEAIDVSLKWFKPKECFRRDFSGQSRAINRALFDLVLKTATSVDKNEAQNYRKDVRRVYSKLLSDNEEFQDLISRAVDHTKRMKRRFEIWNNALKKVFK